MYKFWFEHKLINGRTQLIWNEEIAKNLCNRYGLNFEEIKDGSLSRDTEEDLTSSTNSTELVI